MSVPQTGLYSMVEGHDCIQAKNCGDAVVAVPGAAVVVWTLPLFTLLPWPGTCCMGKRETLPLLLTGKNGLLGLGTCCTGKRCGLAQLRVMQRAEI